MRELAGLREIAGSYDSFIIDLWGVMHDGVTLFAEAAETLQHLTGRSVLFLSNAPRRAYAVQQTLDALGLPRNLYSGILTSGEATWLAFRDRADPIFSKFGPRAYHLGPERDRSVIEGLPITLTAEIGSADFILNTGPDDLKDPSRVDEFVPELEACLRYRLPMVCANPDLEIVRGGKRLICAGALAAWYSGRGGETVYIGKPDPAFFTQAVQLAGGKPGRTLVIGDSLRTDIAGACAAGLDSAWVLGGIHARSLAGLDAHGLRDATASSPGKPTFYLKALRW